MHPPSGTFNAPVDYKKELKTYAKKNNKTLDIVGVNVPAGGVSFHHGLTWHGSGLNNVKKSSQSIWSLTACLTMLNFILLIVEVLGGYIESIK